MDLLDDNETFTLLKSETDESGEQLDTYLQNASKDTCVPVSSFDHESLPISHIKKEDNADDCSLMMRIEQEAEPDYISTVHTAYRDEPHMDDQPNNTLSPVNKCIKSESSEHIVHHHTNMDMTIYAQQHIEKASVVIEMFSAAKGQRYGKNSTLNQYMLTTTHTGEKQHTCPDCDKRFTRAGGVKQHMLIHTGEKQHACPDCDKRFTQAGHLKGHMLIHTEEKQHACPDCDKRFTRAGGLKQHMLIHTGEKQHACPDCDKRFAESGSLKRHMLIHTGEKQHACPDCDKRFTQADDVKRHMLIHTGEKQHACPDCDKRFTQAGDVKRHMLIHTGDKQHACPDCDKRFTQAGHLKSHMLIHTGEKQHACPNCEKRFMLRR